MPAWSSLNVDDDLLRCLQAGLVRSPPHPRDWSTRPEYQRAFLRLLDMACDEARKATYPQGRTGGRGILTCTSARHVKWSNKVLPNGYFPGTYILLKELRRSGCKLPVTVAYLGFEELDANLTRILEEEFGASVLDLRWIDWHVDPMRILAGWESKIFAILHCDYDEVLFLDSDNLPVKNPEFLFEEEAYRQRGAIFWPDLPRSGFREWLPRRVWDSAGIQFRPHLDFESGQMLINKKASWMPLLVTRHLNEFSDYWYKLVFGDKSTFFLAWRKTDSPFAFPARRPSWNRRAILQYDLRGQILFQHTTGDKPSLNGHSCTGYLYNEPWLRAHALELKRRWNGELWPSSSNNNIHELERLAGVYHYRRAIDQEGRDLELLPNGLTGIGRMRCECYWSAWKDTVHGDLIVLHDDHRRPVGVLGCHPDSDGRFVGQWICFEKSLCTLER